MAYASTNDLKAYLGIGTATDDALLAALLTRAQAVIDEHCNRAFEAAADSTRYYDAINDVWGQLLMLDADLSAVTTVVNGDGVTISSTEYVLQPSNNRPAYAIRLKDNASVVWTYSESPERSIAVTGKFAFSTSAPADIVHATVRLAAWFYRQKDNSADLSDVNVAMGGAVMIPSGLPRDVTALLERYVR